MIRFGLTSCLMLVASLPASTVAIGQEALKARPAAGEPAAQGAPTATAGAQSPPAKVNDPFSPFYSFYLDRQQAHAGTKLLDLDALDTNFGLTLADADNTLRVQLEIPPGQGVVVVGVKAGSLAEHAGLKLNDIILSLGDQKAAGVDEVRKVLLGLGKEALEVKLIREGKARRMSLVGPEHGFPPEAAEYWIGTPVSKVDATLRTHLPSLPGDSGLIVNDVVKGSPADQAGVHKDDILVAMNGKPLTNSDALIAQIQASQGKAVPLQILRAAQPLTITITPARRAHPTVINVKATPDNPYTLQFVRPNMAIEVDPGFYSPPATSRAGQERPIKSNPPLMDSITLHSPYTGILVNPYPGAQANFGSPALSPLFPNQSNYYQSFTYAEPATARIEGQLKEVMAKLEEISKVLEGIKKSTGK